MISLMWMMLENWRYLRLRRTEIEIKTTTQTEPDPPSTQTALLNPSALLTGDARLESPVHWQVIDQQQKSKSETSSSRSPSQLLRLLLFLPWLSQTVQSGLTELAEAQTWAVRNFSPDCSRHLHSEKSLPCAQDDCRGQTHTWGGGHPYSWSPPRDLHCHKSTHTSLTPGTAKCSPNSSSHSSWWGSGCV